MVSSRLKVAAKSLGRMRGLREHRQAAKVSHETLARYSGVSTSALRRYEAGTRVIPPVLAVKVARALQHLGVRQADPVGLVLTTARDLLAKKSAEGAPAAIDALGALKVDARPDATTTAIIDGLIALLAELRGEAYHHGRFSRSEGPAQLDVPFPVRIDDRRPPFIDPGNTPEVGAPMTTNQRFGMKRRDALGRDAHGRVPRDTFGRTPRDVQEAVKRRDSSGRRMKGA